MDEKSILILSFLHSEHSKFPATGISSSDHQQRQCIFLISIKPMLLEYSNVPENVKANTQL